MLKTGLSFGKDYLDFRVNHKSTCILVFEVLRYYDLQGRLFVVIQVLRELVIDINFNLFFNACDLFFFCSKVLVLYLITFCYLFGFLHFMLDGSLSFLGSATDKLHIYL